MERQNKVYLLNTLIIPIDFNKNPKVTVELQKISIEQAKQLLQKNGFISAIGHEGTAKLLSSLLNINIPVNRISIYFEKGDIGIHFFPKQRLPEGKVFSYEELQKIDFWLIKSQVL
jgi:hypothetical protein